MSNASGFIVVCQSTQKITALADSEWAALLWVDKAPEPRIHYPANKQLVDLVKRRGAVDWKLVDGVAIPA